jgi:hypothetical protein
VAKTTREEDARRFGEKLFQLGRDHEKSTDASYKAWCRATAHDYVRTLADDGARLDYLEREHARTT